MFIAQHFLHGYVASAALGNSVEQNVAVGIAGVLPDVIGYGAQAKFSDVLYIDTDDWTVYNKVHSWQWVLYVFVIAAALFAYTQSRLILLAWGAYAFHVGIDKIFHQPGLRWWIKGEGLWFEVCWDVIFAGLFILSLIL